MVDTAELVDADGGAGRDDLVHMESAATDIVVWSHVCLGQSVGLRAHQLLNSNSNLKSEVNTVLEKFAGEERNWLLGKRISKQAINPNLTCVLASGLNGESMWARPAGFLREKSVAFSF